MHERMLIACTLVVAIGCGSSTALDGSGGTGGARGMGGAGGSGYLEGGIEIRGVVRPDATCTWIPDLDLAQTEGTWDLSSASDYLVFLVAENTLESRIVNELQGELHNIQVTDVEVLLTQSDGTPLVLEPLPNPYRIVANAVVPVATGEPPSLEVVGIKAINRDFVPSLQSVRSGELRAELRAYGLLVDARTRSATWSWPIRLCEGCLAAECAAPQTPEGSCTPGQDGDRWCSL